MITALLLIYAHYVADFICQTHAMAIGKSKSNLWLSLHVITYMAAIFFPAALIFWSAGLFHTAGLALVSTVTWSMIIYWVLINGALHWVTDYFTSRWSSKYFSVQDYHNGFNVVGLDQCIHYTCLLLTAKMVIG